MTWWVLGNDQFDCGVFINLEIVFNTVDHCNCLSTVSYTWKICLRLTHQANFILNAKVLLSLLIIMATDSKVFVLFAPISKPGDMSFSLLIWFDLLSDFEGGSMSPFSAGRYFLMYLSRRSSQPFIPLRGGFRVCRVSRIDQPLFRNKSMLRDNNIVWKQN